MRDFWLQEVSGHLRLVVEPIGLQGREVEEPHAACDGDAARVRVRLDGTSGRRGFAVHLRLNSVGIKGEKGTRVPTVKVGGWQVLLVCVHPDSHSAWTAGGEAVRACGGAGVGAADIYPQEEHLGVGKGVSVPLGEA